jgi:hypothetical protein
MASAVRVFASRYLAWIVSSSVMNLPFLVFP